MQGKKLLGLALIVVSYIAIYAISEAHQITAIDPKLLSIGAGIILGIGAGLILFDIKPKWLRITVGVIALLLGLGLVFLPGFFGKEFAYNSSGLGLAVLGAILLLYG